MLDMAVEIRVYRASFALLERDLEAFLEFIEPVDANAACFSHRSYALLLRACTEFESLARDLLVDGGATKAPADMNVNDYRKLEESCRFEGVTVDFLPWRPHPKQLFPYRGWSTAQPPLRWYADYNDVKHNRNARFELANLQTLVESISALFCLVAKASSYDWNPGYSKGWDDRGEYFSRRVVCHAVSTRDNPERSSRLVPHALSRRIPS